jgi:hypothetical protein
VGTGAAFEGRQGLKLPGDFTDGMCNTILVIEAGDPVTWTKPADLIFDPAGPLPNLTPLFADGFRVGLGDGSVRWVSLGMSEATFRAAITRNGGDRLGHDWME